MSINNSTFAEGATLSATGGTTKTWKTVGGTPDANELYVDEDVSSTTRRKLFVTRQTAKVQASAPGGWTQERFTVSLHQPKVLANGNLTVNTAKYIQSVDVETTTAERVALMETMCQTLFGTGLTDLVAKLNAQ